MTRDIAGASGPGRLRFLAPELRLGTEEFNPTQPSDVYSFALTVVALGSLERPFKDLNELMAAEAARNGERPIQPISIGNLNSSSNEVLWILMKDMWHPDPVSRPTSLEVYGCLSRLQEIDSKNVARSKVQTA